MNDQEIIQLVQNLVQGFKENNPQAIQQIQQIQQAALLGDPQAAIILGEIQKQLGNGQQAPAPTRAAKGAKLNYIKRLNGICPEGYKMEYHKMGGRICSKCVKAQEGLKAKNAVEEFKNKRKLEKDKFKKKL